MNTEKIMILLGEVGASSKNNSKYHGQWMKMNIKVFPSSFHLLTPDTQTPLGKRRRNSDEEDPTQSPIES
jgi:hypothetical protein